MGKSVTQVVQVNSKYEDFKKLMHEIFLDIKSEVSSDSTLDKLFIKRDTLTINDTLHKQEPEAFTKERVVERLLEFLGYPRPYRSETTLTERVADYKIIVKTQFILFEAEPINKNLEAPNSGASQVREWLRDRFSVAEYGVATNGFEWKLLKVSVEKKKISTVATVDLTPFVSRQLNQTLTSDDDLLGLYKKFDFNFSQVTILDALAGETEDSIKQQSEVTSRFYQEYIKYIFGIERGERVTNCLLNKITKPSDTVPKSDIRLFAVITMNRLIFTKFLQDKQIIHKDFLSELIDEYNKSSNNPTTFYRTFLKPFFYDVLSKPVADRHLPRGSVLFSDIPYLNGGLFIPTVANERDYDIENDILFEIVNVFLAHYDLTFRQDATENRINPDILGRVFEKTINYITSKSETFSKKEQGAYYTPWEITIYLCENSLKKFLFDRSVEVLKEFDYPSEKVAHWSNYDDLLKNPPSQTNILKRLYQIVDEVKVLDSACGSGHFLKDAGDLLLRINRVFQQKLKITVSTYSVLRHIIVTNLYGVDIDPNAVEIAKLRLWMALIESAEAEEKLHALPNIEYNIRQGNSLVGFITTPQTQAKFLDEFIELDIEEGIEPLKRVYPDQIQKIATLASFPTLKNLTTIKENLIQIYKNEDSPQLRSSIKTVIEEILHPIEAKASSNFLAYVNEQIKAKTEVPVTKRKNKTISKIIPQISEENMLYMQPFHWMIEFSDIIASGGFDVIIENPPYDILKSKDREFFETYSTDFRFLEKSDQDAKKEELLKKPEIKAEWDKYVESFETYQRLIKFLPEYTLQNNVWNGLKWKKSDPNYYRLFIERSNQLLKEKGRLGMICSKGVIGELGSTALRRYLLSNYTSFEFREFNNRIPNGLIFDDVDPNFRFVVFTYVKESGENIIGYCFCSDLKEITRPYFPFERNPLDFYLRLSGDYCILSWIRSEMDFRILKKLSKFPILAETNAGFRLKSAQDIHMTNDRDKFGSDKTTIPLAEGEMINHYSFKSQAEHYVIPEKFFPKKSEKDERKKKDEEKENKFDDFYKERIAIRTILPNSVRKFYSTILPPKVAVANSIVYFRPEQTREEQCFVVGLLNSLLIEYRGKQLLSKMTLNQYILDILPIPRKIDKVGKEISSLSCSLISGEIEEQKRQHAMNKVDALVFKLFGLEEHETKFVIDTFQIPDDDKKEIIQLVKN